MSSIPTHTHCQNCDAPLAGPYCHRCGQHDFDASRSFHHVLSEALESFLHFDTKFFRNIVTVLFQPAVLTQEYNAGKRASQMPPFRLYLFVSVLFFFIQFVTGDSTIRQAEPAPTPARSVVTGAPETKPIAHPAESGSSQAGPARLGLGAFVRGKLGHFANHQAEASAELAHAFPKILLVCLPVFALLTRFLFRAAAQSYLQHLVAAVHIHTFIFLWKPVGTGWVQLARLASPVLADMAKAGVAAWFILYPLIMLHRLYRETWPRTAAKAAVLFVAYNAVIIVCFLGTTLLLVLLG